MSNDFLAVATGYFLVLSLYGLVCTFHFGDVTGLQMGFSLYGAQLQALTKLQPLTYLRAAVHCAAATLLARYMLTSLIPDADDAFSDYVLPACGTVCAYLTMRFAAADTIAVRAMSSLSPAGKIAGVAVNAALFASTALATVALTTATEDDATYLAAAAASPLLVCLPLVALPLVVSLPLSLLSFHVRYRRPGAALDPIGISVKSYLGLSVAYAAIQAGLFPPSRLDTTVLQLVISAGVVTLTLISPLMLTPPTDTPLTGSAPDDVDDALRAADMRMALAAPLLLLLVPIALLSLVWSLLYALVLRLVGGVKHATPDAPNAPHASPVPIAKGGYLGDTVGYFGFLAGAGGPYYAERHEALSSFVWGSNIGCPAVGLLDAKSIEALLTDTDVLKHAHPAVPLLKWPLYTSRMSLAPNFILSGSFAVQRRALYLSLIPTDPSDGTFVQAAAAMKGEMLRWATLDAEELASSPLTDLVSLAITAFSGTLILGTTLPPALLGQLFPLGLSVPVYPAILPSFLIPLQWKARSVRAALHQHVRAAPRWPTIAATADKVGLSHEDAIDAVLVAVGFNAAGMSNSMLNALLLLPMFADHGRSLAEDPIALRSFVWELLRFNGPMVGRVTSEASTTIETSAGAVHAVKEGTFLFAALSECQKDPIAWPEPQVFDARRFVATLSGGSHGASGNATTTTTTNVLPVIGFGVPLGMLGDDEYRRRSHCCAGSRINAPWLEAFVKPLVDGAIVYKLNKAAAAALDGKVLSASPGLQVSLGVETRVGGVVPLTDETPKVTGTAAFRSFLDNQTVTIDSTGGVEIKSLVTAAAPAPAPARAGKAAKPSAWPIRSTTIWSLRSGGLAGGSTTML